MSNQQLPEDLTEDVAKYAPQYEGIRALVKWFYEEESLEEREAIIKDLRYLIEDFKKYK